MVTNNNNECDKSNGMLYTTVKIEVQWSSKKNLLPKFLSKSCTTTKTHC